MPIGKSCMKEQNSTNKTQQITKHADKCSKLKLKFFFDVLIDDSGMMRSHLIKLDTLYGEIVLN